MSAAPLAAALLLGALVAAAPAHAQDGGRPRYRESTPDLAMALARRVPAPFGPAALVAADLAGGAGAALAGAVVGGGAGLAAWGLAPRLMNVEPGAVGGPLFLAATSAGALAGAALALCAWDAVVNTFHIPRLFPSRMVLLGVAAPLPASLLVVAAWERSVGPLPGPAAWLPRLAWAGALCCLPGLGVLLAIPARFNADERDGSPLWDAAP